MGIMKVYLIKEQFSDAAISVVSSLEKVEYIKRIRKDYFPDQQEIVYQEFELDDIGDW